MNDARARLGHLFVVRMWQEPRAQGAGQWRGSVEHVPSGQRLYFASLGDLTDFVALRLGGQAAGGSGKSDTDEGGRR